MRVEEGQQALYFELVVPKSARVTLAQLRSKKSILLVFHPFAFTVS